jgi:hypothetical protein
LCRVPGWRQDERFPDCPGGLRNTGKITFEDSSEEMKGEITAQRATDEQRSIAPDSEYRQQQFSWLILKCLLSPSYA